MFLKFNHDDLKSYLKEIITYEVVSIYSIENNSMWKDTTFNFQENQLIVISAFCNGWNHKKFGSFSQFMWNQEIRVGNYNKYIRKIKLNNIKKG